MFNTLEIIADKTQNTFMVQCGTPELAKRMFRKIECIEHCNLTVMTII